MEQLLGPNQKEGVTQSLSQLGTTAHIQAIQAY
jgi:hypothetical protein